MKNKKSEFSPGPWDVRPEMGYAGQWGITDKDDRQLALVDVDADDAKPSEGWVPCDEGIANAKLMAASPEMLSVLQELVALIGDPDGATLDEAYDKAVAVIAKAKGEA
jgi:hypothetical protein